MAEPVRLPPNVGRNRAAPAPRHLTALSKARWKHLHEVYDLQPWHDWLVQAALEALDRANEAKAILDREGIVVPGRFGTPVQHPAVGIELNSRAAFQRGMKDLNLDEDLAVAPPRRGRYRG